VRGYTISRQRFEHNARELEAALALAGRRLLVLDRDSSTGLDTPGVQVESACEWLLRAPEEKSV